MALINFLFVILGVLVGASLLSGSSVAFNSWYSFPTEYSRFILVILTFHSCISISLKAVKFFNKKSRKEIEIES